MSKNWLDCFLATPCGKYFVKVDKDYLDDNFNIYGLKDKLDGSVDYRTIIQIIRGKEGKPTNEKVAKYVEIIYGLIHARFLMTKSGLELIHKKYTDCVYETCPNYNCRAQCLPYGKNPDPGRRLLMYCPACHDVYYCSRPECQYIDGSAFLSSYIVPFEHEYPSIKKIPPPPKPNLRIFGFKIEEEISESEEED